MNKTIILLFPGIRIALMALPLLSLAACGEDPLSQPLNANQACELASDYLEQEGIILFSGTEVDEPVPIACGSFRSDDADGSAVIDVKASYTASYLEGREWLEEERMFWSQCVLVDYDQGWTVEACLHDPA